MPKKKRYQLIAEDLEVRIKSGEYPPGTYLPGEHRLETIYSVCRSTIRTALTLLKERGIINAVPGCGNLVSGGEQYRHCEKSGIIGLLLPSFFRRHYNLSYSAYIAYETVMECMERHNISVIAAKTDENVYKERQAALKLLNQGVDGLIIFPCFLNRFADKDCGNYSFFMELQDSGVPLVLIDRYLNGTGLSAVFNDDVSGSYNAIIKTAARGFKRIVYFKNTSHMVSCQRFKGYCRAMDALGLEKCVVEPTEFSIDPGWMIPGRRHEEEIERLLDKLTIDCDTLLFTNAFLAPALDMYFPDHRCGGHHVEWLCYDFPAEVISRSCTPYSWVERPIEQIAARGAEILLDKLKCNTAGEPVVEFFDPEIHVIHH